MLDQLVSGLPTEGLKVADACGISRGDPDDLTRCHIVQRLFRAQNRQWAVQSAGVDFAIGLQHAYANGKVS